MYVVEVRYPDAVERWARYETSMIEKYGSIRWSAIATFAYQDDAKSYLYRHQGDGDGELRIVAGNALDLPYKIYATSFGSSKPTDIAFAYIVEANAFCERRHEHWLECMLSVQSTRQADQRAQT